MLVLAAALAGAGACRHGDAPPAREPEPAATTEALLVRARAEERARRYDRARELYQQAVDTAPDAHSKAHAWRQLASALLFWGEIEEGARALERVVELRPDAVSAWHDLGVVRGSRGDLAGAEVALRRAIALAPDEPRPRVALAATLVKQRRWRDAIGEYEALERLELPEATRRAVARALEICRAEEARGR